MRVILVGCGLLMGMFDTFMTSNEFKCPSCSKDFKFDQGIQSKKFESYLETFRTGDMPMEINEHRQVVDETDWCPHCDKGVQIFFAFHRGVYVETFDTYEEAELASKQFDIMSAYRTVYKNKVAFTDNFNSMRNDLMSVHELHSKKPTKSRFSPFMLLRQSDVLDYNIVTTIKNIIDKYKTF